MVRKITIKVMKTKVSFIDTKTLTDYEYKCEGQCQGHKWYIFKKGKKQQFSHILEQNFVMFPENIYKSFGIITKIIIATI